MNTKAYTQRLNPTVASGMTKFAGSECCLVKKDLNTQNNRALNCHYNVKAQVEAHGGQCINGWLLDKTPSLINHGIWHWTFHSIWETKSGEWFDITIDKHNGREYSPFWADKGRTLNLIEGYGYNDIIIFASQYAVDMFSSLSDGIVLGEVFWTARGFSLLKHHSGHTGQYRYLRKEFSHNFDMLESDYNVRVVDGKLCGEDRLVPVDIFFDYSVS